MVNCFILATVLLLLLIMFSKSKGKIFAFSLMFFLAQIVFNVSLIAGPDTPTFYKYFTADRLGMVMFSLTSLIGLLTVVVSYHCVTADSPFQLRMYYMSLVLLDLMLLGTFLSNNIIVNWIFLEGSTLAVAAISYHNRNFKAVEATWKYIFISSVGVAIAYMGILLLGHELSSYGSEMNFIELKPLLSEISPLMLKIAFLLIFIGYSVKLEVVPLYTSSIDVNHSSPTPASGYISSILVGATFASILRLYLVFSGNPEAFAWVQKVLLIVGILSVAVSAVYVGRANNYKRLLSYSTVENCGLAMLGLGIGGIGALASLIHMFVHMILKSLAFFQLSFAGKLYDSYRVGKLGGYFKVSPIGALVLIFTLVQLLAFPPSVLFRTEIMMFRCMIESGNWWVAVIVMIMLLAVVYWLMEKFLPLLYGKTSAGVLDKPETVKGKGLSFVILIVLIVLSVIGWVMPDSLTDYINSILGV